ncbi:MAG: hypothetical protein V4596_01575 [Bdellovibrionota bacterium]
MNIFGFENYIDKGIGGLNPKLKWAWKPAYWNLIKNPKPILSFDSKIVIHLEKEFKKGYTLLLSRKNPMIGNIMRELKKKKIPFLYINWDEFIEEGIVYFDESKNAYQLRYKKHSFDLKKVKSIYMDYFELLEVFHFKRTKFNNKEKVFLARWIESLKTLEAVCPGAKWFPSKPMSIAFEVQNKFVELLQAKRIGFNIPKMIYSNDYREVQKFLMDRKSIIKESGLKAFFKGNNTQLIFNSTVVDPSNKKLKNLQNTPCMFQEFIDKKYDLRVVVIGNKVLAAKIESRKDKRATSDWKGREHLVPFKPYKLPIAIEKKLVQFMKSLDFKIANFDLVRGIDGKYYFLEMNRPGQWFFIEALSGIPVTKTLISNF